MNEVGAAIRLEDYRPGALGRICEMQSSEYARSLGFGRDFEVKVAGDMAAFLGRFDPDRDLFKIALMGDDIVGSVALDVSAKSDGWAHLRWFFVADGLRGQGFGGRLLRTALDHARRLGARGIYLWTVDGLPAARHLYVKSGFRLTQSELGNSWGREIVEQRFELSLWPSSERCRKAPHSGAPALRRPSA